jgi:hypothetical protein
VQQRRKTPSTIAGRRIRRACLPERAAESRSSERG